MFNLNKSFIDFGNPNNEEHNTCWIEWKGIELNKREDETGERKKEVMLLTVV